MPPRTRIRISTLEDLAAQLRFSPAVAVRRQIASILALAPTIDPARTYAEDWIIRRITGYKPDLDDPAQLVGEALLGEFSALIEHLAEQSGLQRADLPEEVITASELLERWSVNRKTLERLRRRGLLGVRLKSPKGKPSLYFFLSSVRTVEAARQQSPKTPPRRQPRPGTRTRRSGTFVTRAWRRAIPPSLIARRLGLTRASIHRLLHEDRAARLRRLDLTGPASPHLTASESPLKHESVRLGLGRPGESDARDYVVLARTPKAPDHDTESARAHAYHFLRQRAAIAIRTLPPHPGPAALDAIETDLRWATLLKIELLREERGLILRSIEERVGVTLLELPAELAVSMLHGAISAAATGVDRYDPTKGGRLAAPISVAIARALGSAEDAPPRSRATRALPMALPMEDWTRSITPWQVWLDPMPSMRRAVERGAISAEAAAVLMARFGWGVGPPQTLKEMEQTLGVSSATVARMLTEAARAGRDPPRAGTLKA